MQHGFKFNSLRISWVHERQSLALTFAIMIFAAAILGAEERDG
jgi:hypothetical protein